MVPCIMKLYIYMSNLMSLKLCYFIYNISTCFGRSLPIIRRSYTARSAVGYGKVSPSMALSEWKLRATQTVLGARRGWVVSTTPRPLYPRERPSTHCTGGWVGPRAGLDVCEISRPHRDSISGPSSPQSVSQSTELIGPRI
jgi:hypothetical protein